MDNTFWATVALFIFIAIIVWYNVPAAIAKAIDQRSNRIRAELDEARRLREEGQQILADLQRKRKEAEKDAADIVEAARREAGMLLDEAKKKTADYVTRRTALAEQKIGQAEREAVAEVKSAAVDIAVEAARKVLAGKVDADARFRSSLQDVKANFN